MPVIRVRQPLRERCNIRLQVETMIPTSVDFDYDLDDLHERGRSRTRTGRFRPIGVRVPYIKPRPASSTSSTSPVTRVPRLHPIDTPSTEGFANLHQLVPYIYIGFYTDDYLPRSIMKDDGGLFTHVVRIVYTVEDGMGSKEDRDEEKGEKKDTRREPGDCDLQVDAARGMSVLTVAVSRHMLERKTPVGNGRKQRGMRRGKKKTALTEEQLLLARDFLALALPYYAQAHPPNTPAFSLSPCGTRSALSADSARVLITMPLFPYRVSGEKEGGDETAVESGGGVGGGATDIMSIVACYLAWASEEPAGTVVRCIKAEEEVPPVWRDALGGKRGGKEVEFVERVARFGESF